MFSPYLHLCVCVCVLIRRYCLFLLSLFSLSVLLSPLSLHFYVCTCVSFGFFVSLSLSLSFSSLPLSSTPTHSSLCLLFLILALSSLSLSLSLSVSLSSLLNSQAQIQKHHFFPLTNPHISLRNEGEGIWPKAQVMPSQDVKPLTLLLVYVEATGLELPQKLLSSQNPANWDIHALDNFLGLVESGGGVGR